MRAVRLALTLLAAAVFVLGCAPARPVGEPIDSEGVARLARGLSTARDAIDGLRGSGNGEITVSGRGSAVTFAFVYSRPGWLRVDVRPELGSAGHAFSSLSLLDGECLRTYFPGQAAEAHGCLSDMGSAVPETDLAALALGIPDLAFLAGLEEARLAREGESVELTGLLGARRLTLRAGGAPLGVTGLTMELSPGGPTLRVDYSGRGWNDSVPLPRSVEIAVGGGDGAGTVALEFRRLQRLDRVDRADYEFEVSVGARSIHWSELDIGREP